MRFPGLVTIIHYSGFDWWPRQHFLTFLLFFSAFLQHDDLSGGTGIQVEEYIVVK